MTILRSDIPLHPSVWHAVWQRQRDLRGESANVIAIIGDGSLSGGEALEGMDFAAELDSNMIIVVNDNDMSIAENHGGLYSNLKLLRETNGQAECNLFKAMGLDYVYVDHGNDLRELIGAFKQVKDSKKPVVVHINTLKGKGYKPAEEHKEEWHWHLPFDIETGKSHFPEVEDYSSVTCEYLIEKMKKDPTVVAITSGTPTILGFTQEKRKQSLPAVCRCGNRGGDSGSTCFRNCQRWRKAGIRCVFQLYPEDV